MKEIGRVTHTGQESGDRSYYSGHRAVLLTGLLFMVCSACFLINSRTTNSRMAPLREGWVLRDKHSNSHTKFSIENVLCLQNIL